MTALRIAVTGATGFTGEHLVRRLAADGHRVTAVVRHSSSRTAIERFAERFAVADLERPGEIEVALRGHDALIHMASMGFTGAPALIAAVERAGIRRAVFTSTTAILTRLPVRSKPIREAAEQAVARSALEWTIIRPTMIYGTAKDRNICRLLRFIRRYRFMALPGGGTAMQQPVHVEDVAEAALLALGAPASIGRAYNLSGAQPLSFRALVQAAASAVGVRPLLVPVPVQALARALAGCERLRIPTRLRAEQVLRIAEDKAFPHDDAVRDFGFRTRPFEVGAQDEAHLLGLAPKARA
jgi:nucleoside-diphosphate-sugar epimerase